MQTATVVADASLPYRVGAYELVFAEGANAGAQARRAALLVDLVGGNGHARGFVEWGRGASVTDVYSADGWARQRALAGELVTVFELALNHRQVQPAVAMSRQRGDFSPLAIRVVVNEASGASR